MLATQIGNFTGVGTTAWNGIPTSCHIATLYWVFTDEFSRPPAQADFLNHFGNPNAIITRMLSMGHRLTRPNGGTPLALTPGSVIVFERGGQPVHSCVALNANRVGGYNQLNWFTGPGANHNYTSHHTSEIVWHPGLLHGDEVQGNTPNQWCHLVSVPEAAAKAVVRHAVQG